MIITKDKYSKLKNIDHTYIELNIVELISIIEDKCEIKDLMEIRDILLNNFNTNSKSITSKTTPNTPKKISLKEFNRIRIIEKKLKKELVFPDYYKHFSQEQLYDSPFEKFKDMRFILRAYDDTEYPEVNEKSNWSRTFLYDFYQNGLLIWLSACIGVNVIVNTVTKEWFEEDRFSSYKLKENEIRFEKGRIIGKIPYNYILDLQDGDEYYDDYHIFCKYWGIEESPFEQIVYLVKNKYGFWVELDNKMRIFDN